MPGTASSPPGARARLLSASCQFIRYCQVVLPPPSSSSLTLPSSLPPPPTTISSSSSFGLCVLQVFPSDELYESFFTSRPMHFVLGACVRCHNSCQAQRFIRRESAGLWLAVVGDRPASPVVFSTYFLPRFCPPALLLDPRTIPPHPLLCRCCFLHCPAGIVGSLVTCFAVFTAYDLLTRRRLEELMGSSAELRAQDALAKKRQTFLSMVSHEVRPRSCMPACCNGSIDPPPPPHASHQFDNARISPPRFAPPCVSVSVVRSAHRPRLSWALRPSWNREGTSHRRRGACSRS